MAVSSGSSLRYDSFGRSGSGSGSQIQVSVKRAVIPGSHFLGSVPTLISMVEGVNLFEFEACINRRGGKKPGISPYCE